MAKRWLIFVVGMFLMGTGIALIIKASLGVSPISSFTTVLNKICPALSLGMNSFLFSVLLLFGEIILAPKKWSPALLLQLIPSAISGVFIDVNMVLLSAVSPNGYLLCMVTLIVGCLVFGLSLALMVSADAMLMPTEGFISVVAERFHLKWGNVKSGVDLATVVLSAVICLIAFQSVYFIREGTLISAILIGQFTKFFQKWTDKLFVPRVADVSAALPNSES